MNGLRKCGIYLHCGALFSHIEVELMFAGDWMIGDHHVE
jgi:hypothetical protein